MFLRQVVAAFAVSAVASQWERTGKPFNPLLGETYELIRYKRRQWKLELPRTVLFWWLEMSLMRVFKCLFLKRGWGLQIDLGAGEPPPPRQCLPRSVSEAGVRVPWLHLPQTQVLGQKCGGWAQRHHDTGVTEVSRSSSLSSFLHEELELSVGTWKYVKSRVGSAVTEFCCIKYEL